MINHFKASPLHNQFRNFNFGIVFPANPDFGDQDQELMVGNRSAEGCDSPTIMEINFYEVCTIISL